MKTPPMYLWLDQYGAPVWARTRAELIAQAGPGRVSIQYSDMKDGRTVRTGYVIGHRWFTQYAPVEKTA